MNTTALPTARRLLHGLLRMAFWVGVSTVLSASLLLVLGLVVRAAIRPAPGTWATTVAVGPLPLEVGVPSLDRKSVV